MRKTFLLFFLLIPFTSYADEKLAWDRARLEGLTPGQYYTISSGTGFFVTSQYIVTNAHVVTDCLTIAVRGAIPPTRVQLLAIDPALDLAILGSPVASPRVASMRSNTGLTTGAKVFVMGYPEEHGESGQYLLLDATVTGLDAPFEEAKQIELTQSVEHGNSGGPLIDSGGNVIGVIVAKSSSVWTRIDGATGEVTKSEPIVRGVAIGLHVLRDFLQRYGVYYRSNSTYDMFTEYRPDRRAREYIVNVHCASKKN